LLSERGGDIETASLLSAFTLANRPDLHSIPVGHKEMRMQKFSKNREVLLKLSPEQKWRMSYD